jgi:hypothetical protein
VPPGISCRIRPGSFMKTFTVIGVGPSIRTVYVIDWASWICFLMSA